MALILRPSLQLLRPMPFDEIAASAPLPIDRFKFGSVLLILCAVIAYLPAINAGFIWDDDLLLTANPQMHSARGLTDIWLGKNSCDYTPLALTIFWIEHALWGNNPT